MIPHINDRLNKWARWVAIGRKVRGLGYPSVVAFARTIGTGHGEPEFDEDAWEVDQACRALPAELRDLIALFYTRVETVESIARKHGCSRDTIYVRLHTAHIHILGSLNDIAAGIFRQPIDNSDRSVQSASNCG